MYDMKNYTMVFFVFIAIALNAQNKNNPTFKEGDRIVFIGNSITQDGRYHNFFHLYNATRFPNEKVAYFNAGIAGDVAGGMLHRFNYDILERKPTHAFLMTGMNDVNRFLYSGEKPDAKNLKQRKEALNSYMLKTEEIAKRLVENGIKPIFITPSIYDQTGTQERNNDFGTNDALAFCAEHIKKMGEKYDAIVVDFHSFMETINKREQAKEKDFTIVGPDRIHPQDLGHLIMGFEMMKTVSPTTYVSNIVVNSLKKKVEEAFNAKVVFTNKLEFKVLESALPFPLENDLSEKANKITPINRTINNQFLRINKLKEGNYTLMIDNVSLGEFTSKVLKTGVNLSDYKATPQYKQAEKVAEIVNKYHKTQDSLRNITFIEFRMLRDYKGEDTFEAKKEFLLAENAKSIGKSWHDWNLKNIKKYFTIKPKEDALWKRLKVIRDEIYSTNKPKWHTYKLIKQ